MAARRSKGLFQPARRRRGGCLLVFVLLIAAITIVLSLNTLSNRYVKLEQRSVTVLNLPKSLEGFRILHLSDLNCAMLGQDHENLKNALGKESYSAVVMTGDMVGKGGKTEPLLDILALIPKDTPIFLIAGDSDPDALLPDPHGTGEVKADYILQAEQAGAIYLEAPYKLEYNGQVIWFAPGETFTLDLDNAVFALKELIRTLSSQENPYEAQTGAQLRFAEHRLKNMEASVTALKEMKRTDVIIAVMHHPPDYEQITELSAKSQEMNLPSPSLFLAGQFNAGQIRLPGLGPVYIPVQPDGKGGFFPGDEGFTGLSIVKGYAVYISPGLGVSAYYPLPLRLFNRPAATLVRLTAQMTR